MTEQRIIRTSGTEQDLSGRVSLQTLAPCKHEMCVEQLNNVFTLLSDYEPSQLLCYCAVCVYAHITTYF